MIGLIKRGVLLLFLALLPSSFACEYVSDCPLPDCMGSVRTCESGVCTYSPCLTERKNSTFDQFSQVLDTSAMESDTFGMLAAFGLSDVFSGVLSFMLIFASSFAMVFLLIFMKSKSKTLFIITFTVCLLFMVLFSSSLLTGENMFRYIIPSGLSIEDIHTDDVSDYIGIEPEERSLDAGSFSEHIADAREYRWPIEDSEVYLMVLEAKDAGYVSSIDTSRLGYVSDARTIEGETVFISDSWFWDEDRFIFILKGPSALKEGVAERLIGYEPSLNRLKVIDRSLPEISFMLPKNGVSTSSSRVAFNITDPVSGIDMTSLTTSLRRFGKYDDCVYSFHSLDCDFEHPFSPGKNSIRMSVKDNFGNNLAITRSFIYDPSAPMIRGMPDGYLNESLLTFTIIDEVTGINTSSVRLTLNGRPLSDMCYEGNEGYDCELYNLLDEGPNSLLISVSDKIGNSVDSAYDIVLDTSPPKITFLNLTTFRVWDEISGIRLDDIRSEGMYPAKNCVHDDGSFICDYQGEDIEVEDIAGNSAVY